MRKTEIEPLDRRHWRRLERRAVAAYQRELVATLRRLGDERTPVSRIQIVDGRAGIMLSLDLPEHRLALAGTANGACAALRPQAAFGSAAMVLSGAGRYGRAWWLTLTVGAGAVTVLGSHVHLIPHGSGHAVWDDGPGPSVPCSALAGVPGELVTGPTMSDDAAARWAEASSPAITEWSHVL